MSKRTYDILRARGVCPNDAAERAPGHIVCQRCLDRMKYGWNLKRYGLTPETHKDLLDKHDNACAVCKKSDTKLCVDHDHKTNEVRGILCKKCNQALGLLQDSAENIEALLRYIQAHSL